QLPGDDSGQKGDKRDAIMCATLELVAENGLQNTPMSLISKRSQASAGIIYHYFDSKDDLIQSLFVSIRNEWIRALLAADDPAEPLTRRFQLLMLSTFRYCVTHPQEMAFWEQCASLPITHQEANIAGDGAQVLYSLLLDLRSQDLIKNLP